MLQRADFIWVKNMRITKNKIIFEQSDMSFVKKLGIMDAAQMVLNYKSSCSLPFIYDTYQLSDFFGIRRNNFFDLVRNCDKAYQPILLKKKNGKLRQIHAPNDQLKKLQNKILHEIISKLPVSEYATAYIKGGTLIENASPHVGKRYLLKLVITDFFGSIYFDQVYSAAFHTRYFPKQIGVILTTLCCRKEVLPQGAPTSPALSNIVMRNFDDNIGRWCKKHDVSYTRYCDDMTFSSDKPLFVVYQKVKTMLEEMGFELNEKKTHFVTHANRQSVTGLTVNKKISVQRDYKRALRQEVYYVLKYGLADNIIRANRKEFITGDLPDVEKYYHNLLGRVAFVLQIEPENTMNELKTSDFLKREMRLWENKKCILYTMSRTERW